MKNRTAVSKSTDRRIVRRAASYQKAGNIRRIFYRGGRRF